MKLGAHLPLIDFGDVEFSLALLERYSRAAEQLGYHTLTANDHLIFSRPWLDGLTALAASVAWTERITLGTSVALPIVRHPIPLAKALAAIDLLSGGGRLVAGRGPGSSARDYAPVGVPFEERWKRLDEVIQVMRLAWKDSPASFTGTYYSIEGLNLQPKPARPGGIPIWIGSWGSEAGLRRVARLADGWLASAYNTTPALFAKAWQDLKSLPGISDRAREFPNAVATMWTYVTDEQSKAERVLRQAVASMVNRPVESLPGRLPIGPPEACAQILRAYREAGAQQVFIWPVQDPVRQLEIFVERVWPSVVR